jgi:hypothetical protein
LPILGWNLSIAHVWTDSTTQIWEWCAPATIDSAQYEPAVFSRLTWAWTRIASCTVFFFCSPALELVPILQCQDKMPTFYSGSPTSNQETSDSTEWSSPASLPGFIPRSRCSHARAAFLVFSWNTRWHGNTRLKFESNYDVRN